MRSKTAQKKATPEKQKVTLLGVIANGSTAPARKLLKAHNEQDAISHTDLEYKLAQLYAKIPDKIAFEKELAMIHPHKDFIIKYCEQPTKIDEGLAKTKEMIVEPVSSNFEAQTKSCACGCGGTSNFDANSSTSTPIGANNGIMVLGILGIITIFALTIKR